MSSAVKTLPKPNLRNLLLRKMKIAFIGMAVSSTITTLAYKVFIGDARKKKYEDFYRTYDPEASLKRMCESGYMHSCGDNPIIYE
ncbi:cytochrome c oxidase subunit 6C-like [Polistes fuscatus]|uniref:cytochrome c oxidase subunit 6C-like n=1 Tax=Polistes fuscatus TaxID=30207 RepID=UPI001CA9F75F|nr:cytochrome c oxidase subunit 6C-like [Polistes fuscatus]